MSDRDGTGRFVNDHGSPGPGRPSKYREEFAEQVYKLCLLGATDEELADFFEVDDSTLYRWRQEHDAFREATTRGKMLADAEMAESLYRRGRGYSHEAIHFATLGNEVTETPYTKHYPPDTQAASLWLRNRQPAKWRDKAEVHVTGSLSHTTAEMTEEEAARVYAENLKVLRAGG